MKRETDTKRWTRDFFSAGSGFSWAEAKLAPEAHADSGGAEEGKPLPGFRFPGLPRKSPEKARMFKLAHLRAVQPHRGPVLREKSSWVEANRTAPRE